ncbi:MAG TPA: efflux RND transporter periplasmic adaptor subunit [Nannocystaceae bacterium]|nr:efflux RND transporter periplasmic adaptor subunit [Nannocystaceae bacterium]
MSNAQMNPRTLLALLLLGAACQLGAHASPAQEDESSRPLAAKLDGDAIVLDDAARAYITIEEVGSAETGVSVRAPARLAFRDNAVSRVGAPIASRVMKVQVRVGDKVRPGDPLATLASPGASGYHAELARAKVELTAAKSALVRQEEMLAKGVGREYEKVAAEMRVADGEERLRAAKRDVSLLGKSFGGTVIVTSQIEGTVLRRNATVGAQVDPDGEPLFEIGNPKDLWVVADVFQDDLPLVKEGAQVAVELASRSEPVAGEVVSIGVLLDTAVRRAPVYIDLKARDLAEGVKAGMFARASIRGAASEGLTVPVGAVLIKDGDQPIVYVENDKGGFVRRDVHIGHAYEDRVQVVSGLRAGDRVAAKGALLIDGAANQLL